MEADMINARLGFLSQEELNKVANEKTLAAYDFDFLHMSDTKV